MQKLGVEFAYSESFKGEWDNTTYCRRNWLQLCLDQKVKNVPEVKGDLQRFVVGLVDPGTY